MPLRSSWKLGREGFTPDTVFHILHHTLLNPFVTLPVFLALRYTPRGALLAAAHAPWVTSLKALLCVGIVSRVNALLNDAVTNNWTRDQYRWEEGTELVVVTGGSDGIGKEVVKGFAERGIRVAVMDVQDLVYEAPPTVQFFRTDLANPASIRKSAEAIREAMGDPTVLINNAGCARGKSILDSTESDIRLTFNVNTLAHFFTTQQFLPSMLTRNHGTIVTVASLAAYCPMPLMVDYAASKAGALAFHEGLSAELASLHAAPRVRCIAVCPGYVRTRLFDGYDDAGLDPRTLADEVVGAVLAGGSAHLVLPRVAGASAPWIRVWPSWMQGAVRKGLVGKMRNWRGRQVRQPMLEGGKGEKEVMG